MNLHLYEIVTNDLDENKDDIAVLVAASDPVTAAKEAALHGIEHPWAIYEIGVSLGTATENSVFLRGPYSCVGINRMSWENHAE